MLTYPPSMQRLIAELAKLPSIGERTATRLAYHLVALRKDQMPALSAAITRAFEGVMLCPQCFFLSEGGLCSVCNDPGRSPELLCIVEKPSDAVALERTGEFRGQYHILHGVWSPLRGKGPDQIRLQELLARLDSGIVREVILGTSATIEGDATALYIARLLKERGIAVTRLAQGIPKGGELEFADDLTLSKALAGRNQL